MGISVGWGLPVGEQMCRVLRSFALVTTVFFIQVLGRGGVIVVALFSWGRVDIRFIALLCHRVWVRT